MRVFRERQHKFFLFGMRAITLGAAAVCMLAIVTWPGLVGTVEAGQHVSEKIRISEEQEQYVPGEVLVLLSADRDRNGVVEAAEDLSGVEAAVEGKIEKRIVLSRGKEVLRVKLSGGKTVENAIAENWGARDRRILVVEPNYRVRIDRTPNDVRFLELWGMNNTGQTGGKVDADIDAPEAWDIATGVPDGSDVIVGVIDSGIDYLHPDLAGNMWVNPGEIPGNGIDDDGNGYVDDVHGYDFYQDDGDPSDPAGHGTHVSGTIAGVGDNGIGVAGVNWRCKLMALRFINAQGQGNTVDAIEAVKYGVENGARILSNSWGGGGYSQSMETAIADARDQGVLFVASAGNSGIDNDSQPHYPSSYDVSNVIAVAATNDYDSLAGFSNFGSKSVDVGAPGVGILSTLPKLKTVFFEDFQAAATPGFGGTKMLQDGPENRWGTVLSPIGSQDNIAARGDWANSRPYLSGSDGAIVTPPLDTRGMRGLTLEFEYRYEIDNGDELSVDLWDGTTWQKFFYRDSNCCYSEDYYFSILIDIPDSYRNEEMKIRFRWFTDTDVVNNNCFGAEVDNIHVRCIEDNVGDYVYKQGTSMATPHVAGVAALVMANVPGSVGTIMSLEELKSRILWTGDPIPALDDITVSGRRLNAYNALTASPGITIVAPNGGESWELSSRHDIEWYSIGTDSGLNIYLYKGGSFYSLLAENVPGSGKFNWEIPVSLPSDSDYRVLITDGTYSDESDGDFELYCKSLMEPNYPDPCDGAGDVGVDTNLIWNFWGPELEPCTITFDGLPYGTMVDGMIIGNVTFGFSSYDASIGSGPGNTLYVQEPYIEGDALGTLTLDFAVPVFGVSYGFVLSAMGSRPDASTMVFYDSLMRPIGNFSADAGDMGFGWMEGFNIGTSTRPIARVGITFSHPQPDFARFAMDNITYSPIPGGGGLPGPAAASESTGMDEAERGDQDANGTEGGFLPWIQADLPEYKDLFTSVRSGDESALKDTQTPETIATPGSTGVLHSGGPDAGDYIFVDSYDPNGPSFDWIEIGAAPPPPPPPPPPLDGTEPEPEPGPNETITGIHLALKDDSYHYPIEIPFSFNFYGSIYNRVAVGSNGTIYFENEYLGYGNCCVPCNTSYSVQRFIAVYWDDLKPNPIGADNVYYSIVGEAPNRILVVQWEKVSHFYSENDRVTCQAQLFEGSNEILLLYADPSSEAGAFATVGIQRDSETGLNYICSEAALEPNLAVLFKYQPPCPTTWDVYLGTDPNAMELIESGLTDTICDPTPGPGQTLMRGMRYYWRVVVKNCCNAIDGNDWSFTTVNIPPLADAGDDRIVECACNTGQGTQVTLDGTGSSDADQTPLTYTWTGPFLESPAHGAAPTVTLDGGCPDEYVITLIVSDPIVDSGPDEVLITVVDTTPPDLNCPPDVTLECPADTGVEANGSATAGDTCSSVTITHTDQWQPGCGNTGIMTRTWTATDEAGNTTTSVQTITVVDTTPPDFTFSVTPTMLWPPTHKMVEITPTWTVSDECDDQPQVSLVDIVMSEGDNAVGDGHTTGDIEIGDEGEIYVRSERSGANSGRLYTITYQAVDDCGNVTVRSATVSIPHDFKVLSRIADRWLLSGREGSIQVDFNNDGIVNLADFARFAENWIQ